MKISWSKTNLITMKISRPITLIVVLALSVLMAYADDMPTDSLPTKEKEKSQELGVVRRTIREFDRLDTRYIEPQHYVFTVMVQGTYTYDHYALRSIDEEEQSITFASKGSMKVGPYFGWKWIFAGYTFTLGHSSFDKTKTEIDFSIYSSQIGADLFYRRTGSDYTLRNAKLKKGVDMSPLDDMPFDGIRAGITGFNVYYIFNHGRFSYPAAFAQSTCQKISCGSWLAGIGYTNNTLEFDHEKFQEEVDKRMGANVVKIDSSLMFQSAEYSNFSISGGYAYNWVFARNWLLGVSTQLALAYKKSSGTTERGNDRGHFYRTKINPGFNGRFGLVYNNMRWYAGLCGVVYSNYNLESRFTTNNTHGYLSMYVGYNFGLKKKYQQQ